MFIVKWLIISLFLLFININAYAESKSGKLDSYYQDILKDTYKDEYHDCMIEHIKPNSTNAHRKTVQQYCKNKVYK